MAFDDVAFAVVCNRNQCRRHVERNPFLSFSILKKEYRGAATFIFAFREVRMAETAQTCDTSDCATDEAFEGNSQVFSALWF